MAKRNRATIRFAKTLRSEMTEAEKALWQALRAKRFANVKFTRQVPVGPYIADFAARRAGLIIELDGGQHTPEGDAKRTAFLKKQGYRVLRFWNNDVLTNLEGVLIRVGEALRARPLPNPLPSGEREED